MTDAEHFSLALIAADMPDEDVELMHAAGMTAAEIAGRVAARSGLDATPGCARAWLLDIGADTCTFTDGHASCDELAVNDPAQPRPRCGSHRKD